MDAQLIWPSFEIDYPQRLPARSRDRRREGAERLLALHTRQVGLPLPTAHEILRLCLFQTSSANENNFSPSFSYGEFMTLFAKTVAERTRPAQRQDVEEQGTKTEANPFLYSLSKSRGDEVASRLFEAKRLTHNFRYQTIPSTPTAAPRASAASSFPTTNTPPWSPTSFSARSSTSSSPSTRVPHGPKATSPCPSPS